MIIQCLSIIFVFFDFLSDFLIRSDQRLNKFKMSPWTVPKKKKLSKILRTWGATEKTNNNAKDTETHDQRRTTLHRHPWILESSEFSSPSTQEKESLANPGNSRCKSQGTIWRRRNVWFDPHLHGSLSELKRKKFSSLIKMFRNGSVERIKLINATNIRLFSAS